MRRKNALILMQYFLDNINEEFDYINSQLSDEDRRPGGVFSLFLDKPGEVPLLVLTVGDPFPEKANRYFDFSLERARRLREHPDHLSSYQSRDPGNNKHGGAIRAGELLFSFSGLHGEFLDEALVLNLVDPNKLARFGLEGELPGYEYLYQIALISHNPFYPRRYL